MKLVSTPATFVSTPVFSMMGLETIPPHKEVLCATVRKSEEKALTLNTQGLVIQELVWLRGVDLNHRPLGYEPNELPDCSTPQFDDSG